MKLFVNSTRNDNVQIITDTVQSMCPWTTAQYAPLYATVFAYAAPFLDEWDRSVLLTQDSILSFAMIGDEVVAGLSCSQELNDDGKVLTVRGLVSNGKARSVAPATIAAAIRFAQQQSALQVSAQAIIRETDGKPNIRSAKALVRNGFYHAERIRGSIEYANSHFLLSEPEHIGTIAIHRLAASPRDLTEFGNWVLQDWKELPV